MLYVCMYVCILYIIVCALVSVSVYDIINISLLSLAVYHVMHVCNVGREGGRERERISDQ